MKHHKRTFLGFSIFLFVFSLFSCAGDQDKLLEEIQFLLDDAKFEQAVEKARTAVANDSTDINAQFLLASALIGNSVLSGGGGCPATDTGFLGLIACLQDEQSQGESGFLTFTRIAPSAGDKITQLEEARDILVSLTAQATGSQLQNIFLQLYFARLFEISGAITRIGANSENNGCNNFPTGPLDTTRIDDIPDEFNPNALNDSQSARFQNNLDNVNSDATNAGLPSDFTLNDRITNIVSDLTAAINAAANLAQGTADFFSNEFAGGGKSTCQAK